MVESRLWGAGVLALVVLLSGCASNALYKGYSVADASEATAEPYMQLRKIIAKKAASKEGGAEDGLVDTECFGALSDENSINKCTQQRNEAVAALVIGSETQCLQHRRSIYGNDASANIALGTAAGLFAGWASVLTNTHPYRSSILGAMSLFATSERALVNETVYKTMIVSAVDQKIGEARASRALALKTNLGNDATKYTINQALADWVDFHNSCSFMTGLQLALAEGTQGANAQKMLRLRANFDSVSVQYRIQNCAAATNANDAACSALKGQIDALTDALKTASVQ